MSRRWNWNWYLILGIIMVAIFLGLVLLPSVVSLPDPHVAKRAYIVNDVQIQDYPVAPFQTAEFPLGTDAVGRNYMSRLIYGARYTFGLALVITIVRALVSLPLGLWIAWRGGWATSISQTLFGGLSALPQLFLIFVLLNGLRYVATRPADWALMFVLVVSIAGVPRMIEQVRLAAFQVKANPYVESGIAIGAPTSVLLRRYILRPMSSEMWIVTATEMAVVLFSLAQLGILGFFPGPKVRLAIFMSPMAGYQFKRETGYIPEWGQMLSEHLNMLAIEPWLVMIPAAAFALSIFAFQLLAEGLRRLHQRTS